MGSFKLSSPAPPRQCGAVPQGQRTISSPVLLVKPLGAGAGAGGKFPGSYGKDPLEVEMNQLILLFQSSRVIKCPTEKCPLPQGAKETRCFLPSALISRSRGGPGSARLGFVDVSMEDPCCLLSLSNEPSPGAFRLWGASLSTRRQHRGGLLRVRVCGGWVSSQGLGGADDQPIS